MYPTQFMQIFGSAFCVQQLIIPERLNQIYIVAHRWKEEILSFPMMCHSSKSVTCIKFKLKGRATMVARLAGAPIVMFINIYAGESPIRKTCNFDKPLNHILKVMDGCMHRFCLVKHQNTQN